jgi:NADH:ubiquinone oxidoreductase subunit 2 (subunit N)
MILLLSTLLYIVMVTLMGNQVIRGILLSRLAILVLALSVGLDLLWLHEHPFSTLALVDYQLILDDQLLLFELLILLIGLVLLASQLGHQLRNNPIAILLIIANIGVAIILISSKDWLVTLAAWELFNLALYLLAGAMGLHYFLLSATFAQGGAPILLLDLPAYSRLKDTSYCYLFSHTHSFCTT